MKYLIIRLGAIGDVIHSSVIAQAIKSKYPESQIHFLTADYIKPLLDNSPYIDEVISFEKDLKSNIFKLFLLGLKLRKEKYDVIFNLSNTIRNILLISLSGAKKVVKRSPSRVHAVDAFFNSAKSLLGDLEKPKRLSLKFSEEKVQTLKEKIKDCERPFIVFSPGGDNDNKRQGRIWADKYWIDLGNMLNDKYGGTIFICGSKGEADAHKKFECINGAKLFSGKLSLEESAILYSLSDLFIGGDSGPLHISSCFDTKIVALMGSVNPVAVQPFGHPDSYIEPKIRCRYCGNKVCQNPKGLDKQGVTPCMKSITPDVVMEFISANNKL